MMVKPDQVEGRAWRRSKEAMHSSTVQGHGKFQKLRKSCRGWSTIVSKDKVQGGWWDLTFR